MKKTILPILALLLFGCKKDNNTPDNHSAVALTTFSFDQDSNSSLMFKDGESTAIMTSESRRYEIGKVLRVKALDKHTIEIANFAPVDIVDATILMSINGIEQPVKLFKIGKIRAHAIQEIKYPFIEGKTKFFTLDNKEVDLSDYKTTGLPTDKVSFDFTGDTELIKKLKTLSKLKWKIKYNDFDGNDNPKDNWKENMDARDIRRFSGFIINLGYLIQEEATRTAFIAEPITDNNNVFMTKVQKEQAFQKMIDIPSFNCGVVVNVSGLGGGATFGVADHILNDYLKQDICYISIHEMAHMIGFSHNSSMTYPAQNRGAVVATGKVYTDMLNKGLFPIKPSNYYKPSDL